MTEKEQAIWNAAYAAAFIADYEGLYKAAEVLPSQEREGRLPDEMAERAVSAERAGHLADMAVRKYREWRDTEQPMFGMVIED